MSRREYEDLGDIELSPEQNAKAVRAIEQAEIDLQERAMSDRLIGLPESLEPPWVLCDNKDGTYDILPAGRPGTVFRELPIGQATVMLELGNENHAAGIVIAMELWKLMTDIRQMAKDTEIAGAIAALTGLRYPSGTCTPSDSLPAGSGASPR